MACKNLIFVSCIIFFLSSVETRLFFTTYFDHQPISPEPHFRRLSEISQVPSPAPENSLTRASPAPETSLVDPDRTHHRHHYPPRVLDFSPPPPPPPQVPDFSPPPPQVPDFSPPTPQVPDFTPPQVPDFSPPPPQVPDFSPPPPQVPDFSPTPQVPGFTPPPPQVPDFSPPTPQVPDFSPPPPQVPDFSPPPPSPPQVPDFSSPPPSPPQVPEFSPPPPPPQPEPISPAKSPAASPAAQTVIDVLSYGAVGDGVADDTSAFKMAWDDACHADESGTLLVPNHHTFMIQSAIFTGPCRNTVVFQIEGTVVPPDGPESWPKSNNRRQWLVFYRINGMVMQGGGMIDGRGEKWWNLPCKPHKGPNGTTLAGPCDSPVTMRFFWSKNLTVQGIRVRNSPQFHFRFDTCQNVHINSLNIKSPALSPNTDGIHLENTTDVRIYNTLVYNGDDCVSIGAGCHNVDIRNITCGPSHGISIGSLGSRNSKACVSNISVTNSVIRHSDNGVRIKTWQGGFGSVSQITFNNIEMDTVRNPIIIDQYYCDTKACKNQTSAVYISDIFYGNIKGTYDVRSPPMKLACSDAVPCTNLTISGVELYPAQGMRFMDAYCWKAYGSLMTVTIPPVYCLREGIPDAFPPNDGINQC